jgi:hypothetical protein
MGPTGDFQRFVQYDDVARFDFQSICPISVDRIGIDVQAALRPAALLVLARKISAPVLVKSHHACGQVNGLELWMPQWTGSVVVPVRDPRDVCCSVKHHFGMDSYQEAAEFMAYPSATIGGGEHEKMAHMLGTWSDHVGSWWRTERIETHIVRYEDLHENPLEEFTSILRFLGIEDPDPERVEMAEEAVQFDRLQAVEEKSGFPETSEHQEQFFRRGAAGGWTDELPPEVARKIEEDHAEMMDTLGYELGWRRAR